MSVERRSLDGPWWFRRGSADGSLAGPAPAPSGDAAAAAAAAPWRPIEVPGCWEAAGVPVMESGPFLFRREVAVPAGWAGRRIGLRFDGVSYDAVVRVNCREVGRHTGLWDAFRCEVGDALTPGAIAVVEVEVVKPAGLLDGPDGAVVDGPFPLRETLAGFLPYVWGHVFGGIWQSVALEASAGPVPVEVDARGAAAGAYALRAAFDEGVEATLVVRDPEGREVARHEGNGFEIEASGLLDGAPLWSPDAPHLHTFEVYVADELVAARRFGFRSVGRDGATITLNDAPAYPRMLLSWGWYPDVRHANPSPARVRADFEAMRAMGFNGVKYCLWVPPAHVLDIADELGMLVWLELPMWLPHVTDAFLAQAPGEYERIVRQVRHHPSIVLYSLGCELSSAVGTELLERLYRQTKALVGDALVRDNSGSGEAYGGLLDEYAEYYDYHFYAELPLMRPLLDHFSTRTRPEQPFLFGEFCDSDTFRDLRELEALPGGRPWWTTDDPVLHPKGARWQYDVPWLEERLRANGMWDRGAELAAVSRQQALLQRKATLEAVRSYREVSGYVVTGERDTPISTAGVFDDRGEPKFDAAAFAAFNGATVLALAWDRRRAWVHGGDRPAPWDPHGYHSGDAVRAKVVVAHHGAARGLALVRWRVQDDAGATLAEGEERSAVAFAPGTVREATIVRFAAPEVAAPLRLTLSVEAEIGPEFGAEGTANAWPLWVFPRRGPDDRPTLALHDPEGVLVGIERLHRLDAVAPVTVATEWSPALDARVRAGGRALLLVRGRPDDPVPSVPMPFWREGVKVLDPHPAWGDFPHEGWTDLQFFGVTPDRALDLAALDLDAVAARGERPYERVLTRVDARTGAVHAYAAVLPWGEGRLFATTLRFGGGLGEQAAGLGRNVCAQELLATWLRWLERAPRARSRS